MTRTVERKIGQALSRLPLLPGQDDDLVRWAKLLSSLVQTASVARRSPRFRQISIKASIKELTALKAQADRVRRTFGEAGGRPAANALCATVENLHQTSIVALADSGFLARDQVLDIGLKVVDGSSALLSADQIQVLEQASACARKAIDVLRAKPVSGIATTRGAPTADLATVVTGVAYSAYRQLTGKKPTLTVDAFGRGHRASGLFLSLIGEILRALNIKGSPEALVRKAIRQRRSLIKTTKISE